MASSLALLLTQYGLDESELEVYYPGAIATVLEAADKTEAKLARLVRVAATNKAMVQRGLPTIGAAPSVILPSDPGSTDLTEDEKRVLGEKDGGLFVFGIAVGWPFYWRLKSVVEGKKAQRMAQTDPEKFKDFIRMHLKRFAKEALRRELLGLGSKSN